MKCPGQDSRYWQGDAVFEVKCPKCGNRVEFFKDDAGRSCKNCGHRMANPRIDFGCAAYCPHAEQCLGSLGAAAPKSARQSMKDRVAVAMKRYFGTDFRRIGHAVKVAGYVEEINRIEQGDPAVVTICAYLHDIGIKEAECKFTSSAPMYQHQEGPSVARVILTELGAEDGLIAEVCDIIGRRHNPRPRETTNFKVVHDADLIVNMEEKQKESPSSREHLEKMIKKSFLTEAGAGTAARIFL